MTVETSKDGYVFTEEVLKDVTEINPIDVKTPDSWVPRHEKLIRLTGKHPFNCEPPLKELYDSGFITPAPMHYVRNHGAVPKTKWETHTLTVSCGDQEKVLSMDDVVKLPAIERAVTLVCAGNRRKEENMLKQTIGFSWGAAGHGCSVWTGVRLSTFLKLLGVTERSDEHAFVCFDGPMGELPRGDTSYGTSVTMEEALDDSCDIMVAYKQNGKLLTPDHGFPIRMIIPGYIGGRMVKWLSKIYVTSKESQNFYHFNDNRVLPSHVTAAQATEEGWWYKPEYIINQLNINSAIAKPDHNERVAGSELVGDKTFDIEGYAYTGGGRKIIRMEVSLDDGITWELADIQILEKPNPQGKYWCWIFWKLTIAAKRLLNAKEIICRAWDAAMNTQPQNITWNLMGMMNNCWFRVKVHKDKEGGLVFEHPTQAGTVPGGWMPRMKEGKAHDTSAEKPGLEPQPISIVSAFTIQHQTVYDEEKQQEQKVDAEEKKEEEQDSTKSIENLPSYTMAEIAQHNTEADNWIVVAGKVYDSTTYINEHPGGKESILINAGEDTTEEFEQFHSTKAWKLLDKYLIGRVATNSGSSDDLVITEVTSLPANPYNVTYEDSDSESPAFKHDDSESELSATELSSTDLVTLAESGVKLSAKRSAFSRVQRDAGVPQETVVVVGNGMVGLRVLEQIIKSDSKKKFKLVTFCEEDLPAYNRIGLTKLFDKGNHISDLLMAEKGWYDDEKIELVMGRVTSINTEGQKVHYSLSDDTTGERLYDHLILATGADAWKPPIQGSNLKGTFVYRTVDDVNSMIAYADQENVKKCVIIGGGLLGLEAADAMRKRNKEVIIVDRNEWLMSRQIDQTGGKLLSNEVDKLGIECALGWSPMEIIGEDKVEKLFCENTQTKDISEIQCEMVVLCCGIRPRDKLASRAGIKCNPRGGIEVNGKGETNVPGVYAVGDCMHFKGGYYGIVKPGYDIAATIAHNMCQENDSDLRNVELVDSSTKLKLLGVHVASFGLALPDPKKEGIEYTPLTYNDPINGVYKRLIFSVDGTRLLGGILVGDTSQYFQLTKILKAGGHLKNQTPGDLLARTTNKSSTEAVAANVLTAAGRRGKTGFQRTASSLQIVNSGKEYSRLKATRLERRRSRSIRKSIDRRNPNNRQTFVSPTSQRENTEDDVGDEGCVGLGLWSIFGGRKARTISASTKLIQENKLLKAELDKMKILEKQMQSIKSLIS